MKKFLHPLLFAGLTVLMACGDDPLPTPEVHFITDPGVVEVGVATAFENQSLKASSYEWDFGANATLVGSSALTDISPVVKFSKKEDVYVKLTAKTDDGQMVTDSILVSIKERVLTGFFVNQFPLTNGGEAWDPDATEEAEKAPDIFVLLFPSDDANDTFFSTGISSNVSGTPFGGFFDLSSDPVVLTDDDWGFRMYDYDGVDGADPTPDNVTIMTGIDFNPLTSDVIKYDPENGVVSGYMPLIGLNSNNAVVIDVDIFFELR